jgi:hypothetical protein
MLWITLIIQLIPVIMKLIEIAEKLWVERGTGPEKKNMVMVATKEMVITKSDEETWCKIEGAVSGIIDASCRVVVPNKPQGEELDET